MLPTDANITKSATWAGFNATYTQDLLLGEQHKSAKIVFMCMLCLVAPLLISKELL